jgi:antitoxin Phd
MFLEVLTMLINTNNMIPITEANQNFSRVARMVDQSGSAVILKNNRPCYLLIGFGSVEQEQILPDEDVASFSRRIMAKNRTASGGTAISEDIRESRLKNNLLALAGTLGEDDYRDFMEALKDTERVDADEW